MTTRLAVDCRLGQAHEWIRVVTNNKDFGLYALDKNMFLEWAWVANKIFSDSPESQNWTLDLSVGI